MKQGIYIVVSKNEIVKAEMESPECWMYPGPTPMECNDCLKFIEHLASLPRIPIKGKHKWEVWQEVVEDKDFTWKYEFILGPPLHSTVWLECSKEEWDMTNPRYKRIVAIPIEQTKSEQGEKAFGEWQLCPKCNGDGNLARYNSPSMISTDASLICDVCNGAKILARPLLANDNPQTP